ncbi:MAG: PRC-barrel domain-containing protein, partial [Anaerolineae bacterium]|nr:PRC-barrel domain-containing protein [Anaerolineae bacterium]
MLRSAKDLYEYTLQATDGDIGQVSDFYFDDQQWGLRYIVVKTGNWLFGRKVLISPVALGQPDGESPKLPVTLTKEQVQSSPDIKLEESISRQQTAQLHTHYDWPPLERMGGGLFDEHVIGMDSDSIVETLQARTQAPG